MKLGELFCGAGGFAEGAKQAGFKHVWGSDNHTDSSISFKKNQKCTTYCMDVREFTKTYFMKRILKEHGKINGLLFGFPCNDFSLVGKNKKMDGKYGGLYEIFGGTSSRSSRRLDDRLFREFKLFPTYAEM